MASLQHKFFGIQYIHTMRAQQRLQQRNTRLLNHNLPKMFKEENLLESLFAWNIEEKLSKQYDEDRPLVVTIDDQPAMAMMEILTAVYCLAEREDYKNAKRKIDELHALRKNVNSSRLISENVSLKVLDHVIWCTIYHVYECVGDVDAAEVAFEQIPLLNYSPIEKATIHGCKSMVSSNFDTVPNWCAMSEASQAIRRFPECPLWQLLIYKHLRCLRISQSNSNELRRDERQAIFTCRNISDHPFYILYQARMYEECGYFNLAQALYDMAYKAQPNSTYILLKLANGLIKGRKLEMAKVCLDKVEDKTPDNLILLQHKGTYFLALKNYKEAEKYFEMAAASGMCVADIQYAACKIGADKNFDLIKYLHKLLEKYKDHSDRQIILLHLAMCYRMANNFSKACECFIEAIEIDRHSLLLKNFQNRLDLKNKNQNIFVYVDEFFPECKKSVDSALLEKLQAFRPKIFIHRRDTMTDEIVMNLKKIFAAHKR